MKNRILRITICFVILLVTFYSIFLFLAQLQSKQSNMGTEAVQWNETEQLLKKAIENQDISQLPFVLETVEQNKQDAIEKITVQQMEAPLKAVSLAFVLCILFLIGVFGYVYVAILRPFDTMKDFAKQIAAGNFDIPLTYERSNYFGDFTWAFDSMRQEVTKARSMEQEAVENNKTVIATLSHDIKTPIASIRAYAEGLEANLDNHENRRYYLQVIMRKCDEVAKLTNDLFIHSIANMEKLKMDLEGTDLSTFLKTVITELNAEKNDIAINEIADNVWVDIDRKRFEQVMENIISNARKYAGTNIEVKMEQSENKVFVKIRDYGKGIPDSDIPFLFDKFYRGKNSKEKQGAGLGLYIVKYVMQQCKGRVTIHNREKGLEVILELPIIA